MAEGFQQKKMISWELSGKDLAYYQSGCSRRTPGAETVAKPTLFLRAGPGPLPPARGLALTAYPDSSRCESSTTAKKDLMKNKRSEIFVWHFCY